MAKAGTDEDVFTEEQESRLVELIREAVKGEGKPVDEGDDKPTAPTPEEYDAMSPRQRESYIEGVVRRTVDGLRKDEKLDQVAKELEDIKTKVTAKAEGPPQVWSAFTRLLWGDPSEAEKA